MRDFLLSALPQPRNDPVGMILRPLLVVGVMQKARDGPCFFTISTARACFLSDSVLVQLQKWPQASSRVSVIRDNNPSVSCFFSKIVSGRSLECASLRASKLAGAFAANYS
jgi:hypothetical protein